MKKITLVQEYEITLPDTMDNASNEAIIKELNAVYDFYGKYIIDELKVKTEYQSTKLIKIDDKGLDEPVELYRGYDDEENDM